MYPYRKGNKRRHEGNTCVVGIFLRHITFAFTMLYSFDILFYFLWPLSHVSDYGIDDFHWFFLPLQSQSTIWPPMMFIRLPWTPGAISGAQRAVAGGNPTSWSQLDTVPLWNTWSWLILSQVLDLSILPTLNSSSSARTQMEIYQLLDPFNGRCWELKLGISTWKANVLVLNQSHLLFPGAQNSLHCFLPSKAPIIFANNLL